MVKEVTHTYRLLGPDVANPIVTVGQSPVLGASQAVVTELATARLQRWEAYYVLASEMLDATSQMIDNAVTVNK